MSHRLAFDLTSSHGAVAHARHGLERHDTGVPSLDLDLAINLAPVAVGRDTSYLNREDSGTESPAMHVPTANIHGFHPLASIRRYFASRLPDYRATLALIGDAMHDAYDTFSRPAFMIPGAVGVILSWAYSPTLGAWATGFAAAAPVVASGASAAYLALRKARIKGEILEEEKQAIIAEKRAIKAKADKESNDLRIAIETANDIARIAEEERHNTTSAARIKALGDELEASKKRNHDAREQFNRIALELQNAKEEHEIALAQHANEIARLRAEASRANSVASVVNQIAEANTARLTKLEEAADGPKS